MSWETSCCRVLRQQSKQTHDNNWTSTRRLSFVGRAKMRLLLASAALLWLSAAAAETVEVQLQQGAIVGSRSEAKGGRAFYGFLGIPFAQPPVGALRFKVSGRGSGGEVGGSGGGGRDRARGQGRAERRGVGGRAQTRSAPRRPRNPLLQSDSAAVPTFLLLTPISSFSMISLFPFMFCSDRRFSFRSFHLTRMSPVVF